VNLDFDQSCVLLAAFLAATAIKRYRVICLVVFLNFALFEFLSSPILVALDGAEAWPLHAVYVVVGGLTVAVLAKLGCTRFVYWAIFLFSVYNLAIISEYKWGSIGFHDNFTVIARCQMVIELLSMLIMNKGSRYVWAQLHTDRSYNYLVDRIFINRFRLGFKRSI
jgi:hypothetical protein